ncbi:kinase-like protein [Coniochaeta ligniaria NRRL 30616]|uniref:Kinase-like protein n=1 Tax=Coniochaeta ligniaria NRRL 30616 TaxID=1408157 RepID=A0A1J7JXS6_9PEZI|nr:kinase-like protein [Coniochaeta ligniaria NRRL 30616]
MGPNLTSFRDLHYLAESFGPGRQSQELDFLYTSFVWFDAEDHAYFGQIEKPKLQITLEQISSALELIPDQDIYPLVSDAELPLSIASDELNLTPGAELKGIYIKRPPVKDYEWYKEEDCVCLLPATLLEEAVTIQRIAQHGQHPNLVRFHGCRIRRGRITGLVLDGYEYNLGEFLKEGKTVDKERILAGLDAAIRLLHSLGWAHNDVKPANIMVNEQTGDPVLIDFGSCHRIGDKLTSSRGTVGWTEEGDDYTISKESHDIAALEKIRIWLDKLTFR